MTIIAYHRLLVKSSKNLINSGFLAVCSPYADIEFHILLYRSRRLVRAKMRERKTDNKLEQDVAIGVL